MPPRNKISLIRECCRLYFDVGLSQNKIADSLQIGRSTLGNYFNKLNGLLLGWEEINKFSSNELEQNLFGIPHSKFSQEMNSYFQTISSAGERRTI